jgi:phospholipid-transporting ATPase
MADDFARLVFQSNPAASHNSQYQRASDGYPPSGPPGDSHASPQLLDPFFDDEDEGEVPDSAFAGAHSMRVKESNLHLPSQVAPLAGTSKLSLQTNGGGVPQGWTFDQEDSPTLASRPPRKPKKEKAPRRRWKWPWQKEQILTGERVVALNNPDANLTFSSNYVSTTKYNMATFVPKFLFGSPLRLGTFSLRLTSAFTRIQSNSPNTPIYSSFSPLASSKFLVSRPPINGLLLLPCLSSSLRLHSRRSRKISCVARHIFSSLLLLTHLIWLETTPI